MTFSLCINLQKVITVNVGLSLCGGVESGDSCCNGEFVLQLRSQTGEAYFREVSDSFPVLPVLSE